MNFNFSRVLTTTLSRSSGTKFFILAAVLFFASCKKESEIGTDIFPEDDNLLLSATDTVTLKTFTVREDSLRSDESPIVQIGAIDDPVFGKTTAGLFMQLSIPNGQQNLNFGAGAVLDSCTLQLSYEYDYYGDTNTTQTFNVYQMTENIYKDSLYYSNQPKQYYSAAPVGSATFQPRPRTWLGSDTNTPPYLKIPISYSFAQQIFLQSGTGNLQNDESFHDYMKGLYIVSENLTGPGALVRFDPLDSLTRMTMYYHVGADVKTFSFVVNATTAYYSYFTHNYVGAHSDLTTQLSTGAPSGDVTFIQSAAGVKTKIEFPFLDNWKNLDYPVVINKAELVIKADPSYATTDLPVNTKLYLVSIDSAGDQHLLIDMFEGTAYYGGEVNTTTSEYRINLARYFQDLVSGNEQNNGLYLKELSPLDSGRRVVIGGTNSAQYKIYLHLVYTFVN